MSAAYTDAGNASGSAWDGLADPTGTAGNLSVTRGWCDAWYHLDPTSPLVDAGDPSQVPPDASASDLGIFGGAGAAGWDLDGDGYDAWWLQGAYDPATSAGFDYNDGDATVYPGSGCRRAAVAGSLRDDRRPPVQ